MQYLNLKCLIVLIFVLSLVKFDITGALNLTLLHTNDFHARFAPTNVYSAQCSSKDQLNNNCYAGVARLISKANEIRNKTENVLFLCAGDNYVGTTLFQVFKWPLIADFLPSLRYDAMSFGNHEFDFGAENLAPYINNTYALSPTLCANCDLSRAPSLQQVEKSKIFIRDGKKIGVIGYITPETMYVSSPGPNFLITDEIPAIREEALRLKNEDKVDIIIALGHSGYDKDVEIGRSIPEIDIVVGGHSNTFLYTGTPPSIEKPADRYPFVITHDDGNKTLVVTAYAYGKYLGLLNVVFDENGRVTEYNGNPILLDHTVEEDAQAKKIIEARQDQMKSMFTMVIGKSQVFLEGDTSTCRARECNLGNLIADSFVYAFLPSKNIATKLSEGWTKYPLAVISGGSVRASIDVKDSLGNISLENLLTTMPFQNKLYSALLSGSNLKKVFEHSVSGFEKDSVALQGRFLQVSGIKVVYDLNQPKGQRVKSLKVRCGHDCQVPKYSPIDDNKMYNLLINDYMAQGGDGFAIFKQPDIAINYFETQDFDAVRDYFKINKLVTTGEEERIMFL